MKKLLMVISGLIVVGLAAVTDILPAPALTIQKQLYPMDMAYLEAERINTGISHTPPWLQLDPPWDPNVLIPDVYHRNDQLLSMAVDATGRIYVAYQTPWTGTGANVRYGWGLATSTDQGQTWDNRVYRIGSTNYTVLYPEIAITDDGKIYLYGTLHQTAGGSTYIYQPAFMRSSVYGYNNPDSLKGFLVWNALVYRYYPEIVTFGNGNQFFFAQYTVDRTGSNDSVCCLFTQDTIAYYYFNFRPPTGNPGMTSVSVDVSGTDTILIHAIEYYDAAGSDWDVIWYLDTINGSGNFYGWTTANPNHDRYPSVYANQGFAYLAMQSNNGGTDEEIVVASSNDYGASWPNMLNLSNDGAPDRFPRVHGFYSTVDCGWVHGDNQTFFSYSEDWGQGGTWNAPEIVTTAATTDTGYHCVALLHTPAYVYAAWEDNRNFATDSVEIYTSRRVTPIGVKENNSRRSPILLQVSPNPLRQRTEISFHLDQTSAVDLAIYDALGRVVKNIIHGRGQAGNYTFAWDRTDNLGRPVQNGVYFCHLITQNGTVSQSLVLVP